MPLNDLACKKAELSSKPYKLTDGQGLYLLVNAVGRYWRLDYRFAGKRRTLALGVYPAVGLREARQARDAARAKLSAGTDPSGAKRASGDGFETVAREWHERFRVQWKDGHAETVLRRLEAHAFPWLGTLPVGAIESPELLKVLRRIEAAGSHDLAHRVHQYTSRIFRYAIATGRASRDPAADLRGALTPAVSEHRAAITEPAQIGALLRAIDGYQGSFVVRCALQLSALWFVRPGELRHAEWAEFEAKEWRIPAAKMKMPSTHVVPLSTQARAILAELRPLTGDQRWVFPAMGTKGRPMSENTVLGALRRLGYAQDEMTAHGFRSLASTRLHEMGWPHDAIERQLAHAPRDKVSAAYNYAEYLPERRKMMQAWADYLHALRSNVSGI